VSRRLHLMGVGGAKMSGLARVLAARGDAVSGCDRADSAVLTQLRALGIECLVGHDPAHLAAIDELGYSSAIAPGEPELVAARSGDVAVRHSTELLAEIVASGTGVCVAGAHGKTTTSALLAYALSELGEAPTYLVGGDVPQLGASARAGEGHVVVAEADESDGSLTQLRPKVAIVLNIDLDHHDRFPSLEALTELFRAWAAALPADGLLVAADALDLPTEAQVRTFGPGHGEGWRALDVAPRAGGVDFVVAAPGRHHERVSLALPGEHNALNATAALAALDWLGFAPDRAAAAIASFTGAGRRFEARGEARGIRVVDDYAHHPTELAAVLRAARPLAGAGRIVVCFQPHMPWRTRALQREFAQALLGADAACVCELYLARGEAEPGVSASLVVDRARELEPAFEIAFTPAYEEAAAWLERPARPGDLVLTLGAGPVDRVGDLLLERLR